MLSDTLSLTPRIEALEELSHKFVYLRRDEGGVSQLLKDRCVEPVAVARVSKHLTICVTRHVVVHRHGLIDDAPRSARGQPDSLQGRHGLEVVLRMLDCALHRLGSDGIVLPYRVTILLVGDSLCPNIVGRRRLALTLDPDILEADLAQHMRIARAIDHGRGVVDVVMHSPKRLARGLDEVLDLIGAVERTLVVLVLLSNRMVVARIVRDKAWLISVCHVISPHGWSQ